MKKWQLRVRLEELQETIRTMERKPAFIVPVGATLKIDNCQIENVWVDGGNVEIGGTQTIGTLSVGGNGQVGYAERDKIDTCQACESQAPSDESTLFCDDCLELMAGTLRGG
jgi:hypothetical protein